MRKPLLVILMFVAAAAFAQSTTPSLPHDEKTDLVASDLRTLSRIAAVAAELNDSRQVMLAIVDSDVETLREKRAYDRRLAHNRRLGQSAFLP